MTRQPLGDNETAFWRRYEVKIAIVFFLSLLAYLTIAAVFHAPRGYYGTIEQPRFADPWIARSETILGGGTLYRDVFTTTPPLTNFLLIVPSLAARWFGYVNPWATLSFMLFFSLFNLLAAWLLLDMGQSRAAGWQAAVLFLLNPLTFGNTVLRRQDESILVFFLGLALLWMVRGRHLQAAIGVGVATLVKLTGALLVPIGLLHSRSLKYLFVPVLVFLLVWSPFYFAAGADAIFWDVGRREAEHPFQLDGVSLGALWNQFHDEGERLPLAPLSVVFVAGVMAVGLLIAWKRFGVLEDMTILSAAVFLLSPKLHTGFFSILAFTMAPLLRTRAQRLLYMAFGLLAVIADFYKWPIQNFQVAFVLMVAVAILLIALVVLLVRPRFLGAGQYVTATRRC